MSLKMRYLSVTEFAKEANEKAHNVKAWIDRGLLKTRMCRLGGDSRAANRLVVKLPFVDRAWWEKRKEALGIKVRKRTDRKKEEKARIQQYLKKIKKIASEHGLETGVVNTIIERARKSGLFKTINIVRESVVNEADRADKAIEQSEKLVQQFDDMMRPESDALTKDLNENRYELGKLVPALITWGRDLERKYERAVESSRKAIEKADRLEKEHDANKAKLSSLEEIHRLKHNTLVKISKVYVRNDTARKLKDVVEWASVIVAQPDETSQIHS